MNRASQQHDRAVAHDGPPDRPHPFLNACGAHERHLDVVGNAGQRAFDGVLHARPGLARIELQAKFERRRQRRVDVVDARDFRRPAAVARRRIELPAANLRDLACLREPRIFDLWIAKVSRCPRVRNWQRWGCNSYSA